MQVRALAPGRVLQRATLGSRPPDFIFFFFFLFFLFLAFPHSMNMCVYHVFKCAPLFAFHKRGPCVFTVPAPWISDPLGSAPSTVACGVRLFKRLPDNFLNSGGAIARQGAPSPNLAQSRYAGQLPPRNRLTRHPRQPRPRRAECVF